MIEKIIDRNKKRNDNDDAKSKDEDKDNKINNPVLIKIKNNVHKVRIESKCVTKSSSNMRKSMKKSKQDNNSNINLCYKIDLRSNKTKHKAKNNCKQS